MLERLLRKVVLQKTDRLFDFSVVVVDNDASGFAEATVMRLSNELGLNISYDIERERSIPAARNHAVKLARGDYIAIIDDDEFPPEDWLITMYRAIHTFDTQGALGPVYPFFEQRPPAWLLKGGFCNRPIHKTGTFLGWDETRTGNVLLKKEVFDKCGIWFDVACKTSGSDRVFFRDAMKVGCRFIAVEEAPVYEVVPPERWTKTYYIKRALLHGFNAYRNSVIRMRPLSKALVVAKTIAALLTYTAIMPFCFFFGSHEVIKYAEKGAYHLSLLVSMAGIEMIKQRDF